MVIETIAEFKSPRLDTQCSASGIGISFTHIASPSLEVIAEWLNLQTALRASMIEGYQTIATENLRLAEEGMSIALETWPQWE